MRNAHPTSRSGFTLLELLVTIGLLVLLMSIFATVFQLATRTFSVQRGILANDQRSRVLYKQLEDDLRNLSFKPLPGIDGIVPYLGNYTSATGQVQQLTFAGNPYPEQMQGYLYISENDPASDTDDVIQFTVQIPEGAEPLAGIARLDNDSDDSNTNNWANNFNVAPINLTKDHPEFDDADQSNNDTTSSTMAEVAYFLRGNTLYRRQLLLREPLFPTETYPLESRIQPKILDPDGSTGVFDLFDRDRDNDLAPDGSADTYTGNFYSDYDLSAHFEDSALTRGDHDSNPSTPAQGLGYAKIHGESLSNNPNVSPYPLGNPAFRFGHRHLDGSAQAGNPREFVDADNFMGRFTHEETSNLNFGYPQINAAAATNPMTRTFDATFFARTGRLNEYLNGPRKGEDIVMTNVLSFNVQVWDDAIQEFVNLGHAGKDYHFDDNNNGLVDAEETDGVPDGDFQSNTFTSNATYGDALSANRFIFDTWHPTATAGTDFADGDPSVLPRSHQPPLRRLRFPVFSPAPDVPWRESPSTPLAPYYSYPELDGLMPVESRVRERFAVRWYSTTVRDPSAGPLTYPPVGPDVLVRTGDVLLPSPNFYSARQIQLSHQDIFAYQVTVLSDDDPANGVGYIDLAQLSEPNWPGISTFNLDHDINNDEFEITVPGRDDPTMYAEGRIRLKRILNLQPLKAIKITVLFRDLGTDQVRQLSYIESLAD